MSCNIRQALHGESAALIGVMQMTDVLEWRPVPGWPYEVTRCGQVRSQITGRIVCKGLKYGYLRGWLRRPGEKRVFSAHRLVVMAWIGEIPPGMTVNHIDGVKTNNRVENLEVVTNARNVQLGWELGLFHRGDTHYSRLRPELSCRGERHGMAKLNAGQVKEIRARIATREPYSKIAASYGVSASLIGLINLRQRWAHI